MAYESIGARYKVIDYPTFEFSSFPPFNTDILEPSIYPKKLKLVATDATEPGTTIYTDYIKKKPDNEDIPVEVIWWRGISGTPGGFSNYRMIEDDKGIRFAATWDGLASKPTKSITTHGVIECLITPNYIGSTVSDKE